MTDVCRVSRHHCLVPFYSIIYGTINPVLLKPLNAEPIAVCVLSGITPNQCILWSLIHCTCLDNRYIFWEVHY